MAIPVNLNTPAHVDHAPARCWRGVWPTRCLLCRERGRAGRDLCAACAATLPWNQTACPRCAIPLATPATACGACLCKAPLLASAKAVFVYDFPLDRLLPRLKFHGDLAAGRLLVDLMAPACATWAQPQALLPIPLSRTRLRQRGYDQALELARPLARRLHLPLLDHVLQRQRDTAPQSDLAAIARRRNLRGAFIARRNPALPAHVALVDDVMTTGATLHAAALALRRAGVARVDAWVCARVP